MTETNIGQQAIIWKYKTPLKGEHLARTLAHIISPGVYHGLEVSKESLLLVRFQPGDIIIQDCLFDGDRVVKIQFKSSFIVPVEGDKRFIVARYGWYDREENYAVLLNVDTVEEYDVVLCVIKYNLAGTEIDFIDTENRDFVFTDVIDKYVENCRVYSTMEDNRRIRVNPGRYMTMGNYYDFAGDEINLDVSTLGRYDVIGLSGSTIIIQKGIEGGVIPVLGSFLPLAIVHIQAGYTIIYPRDIEDIRPFLSFDGYGLGTRNIDGYNLDDLADTGLFVGSSLTNSPDSTSDRFYIVAMLSDSNNIFQTAYKEDIGLFNFLWYRLKTLGVWGEWVIIPNTSYLMNVGNKPHPFLFLS